MKSSDLEAQLQQSRQAVKAKEQEAEEVTAVLLKVKGLVKNKQKLAQFKEPVVFLERRTGQTDFFEGVTVKEWDVPDQAIGSERKIYFTTPPKRMNYAGETIQYYYCHEDFAFPIDMGHNEVYAKKLPDGKELQLVGVNLRMANVAAEGHRDLIRKVLVAWEKYKTTAEGQWLQGWAKIILYGLLGVAAIYFIYAFFIKGKVPTGGEVQAVANATTVVIGG